jgi:hypothetical protein
MPGNHDVTLGGVPLMLYEDRRTRKQVTRTWTAANPNVPSSPPFDEVWPDWKNGMGWSQPELGVQDGYSYGLNVDSRSPGILIPAGAVTEISLSGLGVTLGDITDSFSLSGHYWLLAGRYALKLDSGTGSPAGVPSVANDFGSGHVLTNAVLARYSGTVYAWIGHTSPAAFSKFDGTTWTTTTSITRGLMGTVYWATTDGVSVQRLVATDSNHTIVHCPLTTDPFTGANWSSSIMVGEGAYSIGSLVGARRHIYISTLGGVYDMDDLQQTVPITPYHADESAAQQNGRVSYFRNGSILYSTLQGLDAVDVRDTGQRHDEANWILPGAGLGIPNETPIWGWPTAITHDSNGDWTVIALFNNNDSYILYGKPRASLGFDGPSSWVWHGAFAKFTNQRVTHLKVRTVASDLTRRLWIATAPSSGAAGTRLYWQSVPRSPTGWQDYVAGLGHTFATSTTIYMTPRVWNAPTRNKLPLRADIESPNVSATRTITLSVSADGDAGTSIGTATTAPLSELAMHGAEVEGAKLQPVVTMTSTSDVPTRLDSLSIRAQVDAEQVQVFNFAAWLQREQMLNLGGPDPHATPEADEEAVFALQNTVTSFTDHRLGRSHVVLVDGNMRAVDTEIERDDTGTRQYGTRIDIQARSLAIPARYSDGLSRYNSARYG